MSFQQPRERGTAEAQRTRIPTPLPPARLGLRSRFHACLAGVCEAPILVAIRRKSAQALAGPPGPSNPLLSPTKVAFK